MNKKSNLNVLDYISIALCICYILLVVFTIITYSDGYYGEILFLVFPIMYLIDYYVLKNKSKKVSSKVFKIIVSIISIIITIILIDLTYNEVFASTDLYIDIYLITLVALVPYTAIRIIFYMCTTITSMSQKLLIFITCILILIGFIFSIDTFIYPIALMSINLLISTYAKENIKLKK